MIALNPVSVSSSQGTDTTTNQTLTVSNTGGQDLTWTIDEDTATFVPSTPPRIEAVDGVERIEHEMRVHL